MSLSNPKMFKNLQFISEHPIKCKCDEEASQEEGSSSVASHDNVEPEKSESIVHADETTSKTYLAGDRVSSPTLAVTYNFFIFKVTINIAI